MIVQQIFWILPNYLHENSLATMALYLIRLDGCKAVKAQLRIPIGIIPATFHIEFTSLHSILANFVSFISTPCIHGTLF